MGFWLPCLFVCCYGRDWGVRLVEVVFFSGLCRGLVVIVRLGSSEWRWCIVWTEFGVREW